MTVLHDNWLDEEKYNNLMSAIREYHQLTKDETVLNRRIAGLLRIFEQQIEMAVFYYQNEKSELEHVRKLNHAHAEVVELMEEIFAFGDE